MASAPKRCLRRILGFWNRRQDPPPALDIKPKRTDVAHNNPGRQHPPADQHVSHSTRDGTNEMPTGKYPILVASYTNDIVTLEFDSDNGTLERTSSTTVGHRPSWIEGHPTNPGILYTGLEQSDGKILALRFEHYGRKGEIVSEISSHGEDPCSVHVDKDQVFAANVRLLLISPLNFLKK